MCHGFRSLVCLSLLLLPLLTLFNATADADDASLRSSPPYWKRIIPSLPFEDIQEALFKDRDFAGSEAAPLLKKAVSSFQNKRYPEAVKQLEDIVIRFPRDEVAPYASIMIADCYSRMAEENDREALKKSVNQYLSAVRDYPSSEETPRGLYQAGRSLFAGGFFYEAIAQLERIHSQYPKSEYVHKRLIAKGIIYFYQKKYSSAETNLRKVVNNDKISEEERKAGKIWLANTLHMVGRYDEAGELYKVFEASSSDEIKKHTLSFLLMGENFMNLGLYKDGRARFQQFLNLYPDFPLLAAVMLRAADAARLEGNKKEAKELYSSVVSLYPAGEETPVARARVVENDIENGNKSSAGPLIQQLLPFEKDINREAALIIADAMNRSGCSSDAANVYGMLLDGNADKTGDPLQDGLFRSVKEAITKLYLEKDYVTLLKLYHDDSRLFRNVKEPRFLRAVGDSHLEAGLPAEAASVFDTLLSLPHSNIKSLPAQLQEEILFKAGRAYLQAGRKGDAEKVINKLLAGFPKTRFKDSLNRMMGEIKGNMIPDGSARGYMTVAMKSLSENRYEEAAEYYNKVIGLKEPLSLASAYIGLGDAYYGLRKFQDAINAYDTGKAVGGKEGAWAEYRTGESYINLGDMEKARRSFQSVVENDKGIYKKMAAEEILRIDLKERNLKIYY